MTEGRHMKGPEIISVWDPKNFSINILGPIVPGALCMLIESETSRFGIIISVMPFKGKVTILLGHESFHRFQNLTVYCNDP